MYKMQKYEVWLDAAVNYSLILIANFPIYMTI